MVPTVKNFFADLPAGVDGETFITLFENGAAKVERVISHSHQSPPGFWYDQADDEWVIVLSGMDAQYGRAMQNADCRMENAKVRKTENSPRWSFQNQAFDYSFCSLQFAFCIK